VESGSDRLESSPSDTPRRVSAQADHWHILPQVYLFSLCPPDSKAI